MGKSVILCHVDDLARARLERTLIELGHRVTVFTSVSDAIPMLALNDAVLMSDRLSARGISAIRKRSESIVLIYILSVESDESEVHGAYRDGADLVFIQPVHAEHLGFLE